MYSDIENPKSKKLAKVLAYVGSENDGEALAAFHAARRLIASDIDHHLSQTTSALAGHAFENLNSKHCSSNQKAANKTIDHLRQQLLHQTKEKAALEQKVKELTTEVHALEIKLDNKTAECKGWRNRAWKNFWNYSKS